MILPESQCGFRRSRSTIDMIVALRQLQEKAVEQQQSLYMVFIDLSKAFDTVDRRYGCPDTFVKIIQEFHDGMAGAVYIGGSTTDPFEISLGLKQGCVLAPTLFTLFLAALLSTVSGHHSTGVFIRTRSDGKLFNLARLKASTKTRELCICELLFADATAIVAHTLEDIRVICKQFEQAATLSGLTTNTKKTVTLYQPPPGQTSIDPHVEIYGTPLNSVKNFTYLAALLHLTTPLMWKLTIVFKLPLERSEECGSVYGQSMVFQSPQSARCTRQLCFQHYCIKQKHTPSIVAILENFPKCISDIYEKNPADLMERSHSKCRSLETG